MPCISRGLRVAQQVEAVQQARRLQAEDAVEEKRPRTKPLCTISTNLAAESISGGTERPGVRLAVGVAERDGG